MDHNMTMAQFLELQRLLEKTTDKQKAKDLSRILRHANVTNPLTIPAPINLKEWYDGVFKNINDALHTPNEERINYFSNAH